MILITTVRGKKLFLKTTALVVSTAKQRVFLLAERDVGRLVVVRFWGPNLSFVLQANQIVVRWDCGRDQPICTVHEDEAFSATGGRSRSSSIAATRSCCVVLLDEAGSTVLDTLKTINVLSVGVDPIPQRCVPSCRTGPRAVQRLALRSGGGSAGHEDSQGPKQHGQDLLGVTLSSPTRAGPPFPSRRRSIPGMSPTTREVS